MNNDGTEDFYIGGAAGSSGALFLQDSNGKFHKSDQRTFVNDKRFEDLGCLFFDSDNDGDQDLYVVSGGNEFAAGSALYQDRLYLNKGQGSFILAVDKLPQIAVSGQSVIVNDFDADGDLDLFIGGRLLPQQYPFPTSSALLENNDGKFSDVTDRIAPGLIEMGLVTDACFVDHDGDGDNDLWVVGEWMAITVFLNMDGKFQRSEAAPVFPNSTGWWQYIRSADLNNDGFPDLVVGNIGLNNKFHPTVEHPLHVYAGDLDSTGSLDIVLSKEDNGKLVPIRGRECTSQQMPFIEQKYPTYMQFAQADLSSMYGQNLNAALHLQATTFASVVLLNQGNGDFKMISLPNEAQISALMEVEIFDVNKDGNMDILGVGNHYGAEVETVRYDASFGCVLLGNGDGTFETVPVRESGFSVAGNAKSLVRMSGKNGKDLLVVGMNDAAVTAVEIQ